jgi:hypothetical protein
MENMNKLFLMIFAVFAFSSVSYSQTVNCPNGAVQYQDLSKTLSSSAPFEETVDTSKTTVSCNYNPEWENYNCTYHIVTKKGKLFDFSDCNTDTFPDGNIYLGTGCTCGEKLCNAICYQGTDSLACFLDSRYLRTDQVCPDTKVPSTVKYSE